MSKIDTGGEAFPKTDIPETEYIRAKKNSDGMTLRDWFAGQAMKSIMLDQWYQSPERANQTARELGSDLANDAYAIADAMIAEKRRTENGE